MDWRLTKSREKRVRGPRPCQRKWRRLITAASLLAALAIPTSVPHAQQGAVRRSPHATLLEILDDLHFSRDIVDVDAVAKEWQEKYRARQSGQSINRWLNREIRKGFYSFAPTDARHDNQARYELPFDTGVPRYLFQGVGGKFSHRGIEDYHAFDFLMPIGTPVYAARAGVVARIVDGFPGGGGPNHSLDNKANYVVVLHEDGSFATYRHLNAGIPVREGQAVKVGDPLGESGDSGFLFAPHLHFGVSRLTPEYELESVRIQFGPKSERGYIPKDGRYYGEAPPGNIVLRVSIDGELIKIEDTVDLAKGKTVQLMVEALSANGDAIDITHSPKTRYVSLILWSLEAHPDGRVTGAPTTGFERGQANREIGQLLIIYGKAGEVEVGVRKVSFKIAE